MVLPNRRGPNAYIKALKVYNAGLNTNKRAWVVPRKLSPGYVEVKEKALKIENQDKPSDKKKIWNKGSEHVEINGKKVKMIWEFKKTGKDYAFYWGFPEFWPERYVKNEWNEFEKPGQNDPTLPWGKITVFDSYKTVSSLVKEYQKYNEESPQIYKIFDFPNKNPNDKILANKSNFKVKLYLDYLYNGKAPSGSTRFAMDFAINWLVASGKAEMDDGIYLWAYGSGIGGGNIDESYLQLTKLYRRMGFYPFFSTRTTTDMEDAVEPNSKVKRVSINGRIPNVYMVGEILDVKEHLDDKFWGNDGASP